MPWGDKPNTPKPGPCDGEPLCIARRYLRPRDADADFPAELVVVLSDGRELISGIPKIEAIGWLHAVVELLFLPPGFNDRVDKAGRP